MKEESLFSLANENESTPLADRVRPQNLSEFVGQDDLICPAKILHELIEKDRVPSLILWGPPGTGKTFAKSWKKRNRTVNLVKRRLSLSMKSIALIRHNKIPFCPLSNVEAGATTENPSFEVNSALLSVQKHSFFILYQLMILFIC